MIKVSVVIAMFNGEKFIIKQLESIKRQTLKVDEVIIIDDASNDNSYSIVKAYIEKNGLQHWGLRKAKENKGWKRTFTDGFKIASGEIIFYCDQDDIWIDDKVERMVKIMDNNFQILCLSSRYDAIDANGEFLKYTADKKSNNTSKISLIEGYDKRFFAVPSGCTLAIRKKLIEYIDLNEYWCGLDRVLCRTAILLNGMYDYDLPLILHRFHENNASNTIEDVKNLSGSSTYYKRRDYVNQDLKQLEVFRKVNSSLIKANSVYVFENMYKFAKARDAFLNYHIYEIFNMIRCVKFPYMALLVLGDIAYILRVNRIMGKFYRCIMKW